MKKITQAESNIILAESIMRLADTLADLEDGDEFLKDLIKERKKILK